MDPAPCGIRPPHFRLPPETRIARVELQVSDLQRSLDYYRGILGLRLLHHDAGTAALGTPDSDAPLLQLRELGGAAPVPPEGRLGLYHFAILLPARHDLGAFLRHLGANGITPGMSDHGVSEALYLSDPDGLGIEVYADRPRHAWTCEEGQLHMSTEPLDARSLLASATQPWRGSPAGTTIGHVHLFVGELRTAANFYHRALGFDQMVWSYPGALFLAAGGYHHHLGTNTWARHAQPAGPGDARLLEWTLTLPDPADVQHAADSLEHAGYPTSPEGPDRRVTDPWGTTLRLAPARP